MLLKVVQFVLFLFLLSCSFSQEEEIKNTIWEQEGYDRILKIEDTTYTYYNYDKYGCSILVQGDFEGRFKVVDYDKNLLVLNPGGIVEYRFKKINKVPTECFSIKNDRDYSFDINFKSFWETFSRNYGFFEQRGIDWEEIYRVYLPKIKSLNSSQDFGKLLKEIVDKFNDGHIRLDIPELIQQPPKTKREKRTYSKDQILDSISNKYLVTPFNYNNGVIRWGIIKNRNIGYIGIRDMNGFSNYITDSIENTITFDSVYKEKEKSYQPLEQFKNEILGVEFIMDKVLKDFNETSSIIIDLRFNGGGYETVSLKLLSYFIKDEKHIFSVKTKTSNGFTPVQKYYIKPSKKSEKKIYLLTSPFSSSSTEIFVLGSLSFNNFERLGSKTNGIFSELLWKQLPNGWEYSLSNEVYMDTKDKTYEGDGIDVDVNFEYSKDKNLFYSSFFSSKKFSDKLVDQIIEN